MESNAMHLKTDRDRSESNGEVPYGKQRMSKPVILYSHIYWIAVEC